jgi:hypothetical protein
MLIKQRSLTLGAEKEDDIEIPFYHTTAYEIRVAKTLCVFIAANMIILLSFTPNRLQAVGLGLIHGYILGMVMSYLIFGINCGKGDRLVTMAVSIGILGLLAALDWRIETGIALSYSLLILAVTLWCLRRDKGRMNGDYSTFSEEDYDRRWFDTVVGNIGDYPVLFPVDVGNRRGDRLPGRIAEVGMGLRGKYRGIAVAKIIASSGFYLCPLSSLVPDPSVKGKSSTELASRAGENPCTVTIYRHEYGGDMVVSRAEQQFYI